MESTANHIRVLLNTGNTTSQHFPQFNSNSLAGHAVGFGG